MVYTGKLARGVQDIYQQQNDNNKIIKVFTSKPLEMSGLSIIKIRSSPSQPPTLFASPGKGRFFFVLKGRLVVLDLLRRLVVGRVPSLISG